MKLNILAFGAHPDDVELGAGGTLAKHAALGYKTGIVDLTAGEMGTRGTPEIRKNEAKNAADILGCSVREILDFRDGFFLNDEYHQLEIIKRIRKYQPEIVLCNAPSDRHPDHGRASELVSTACFLAGLRKIETECDGSQQLPWRPKVVFHYIQFYALQPDLVVDITGFMPQKMESIQAHASQFFNAASNEPETIIASKSFFESLDGRAREYGRTIYKTYGEGFKVDSVIAVNNLTHLF